MSTEANVAPEVLEAIRDVRNDATATDWMLARHPNNEPQEIELAGSGSGGVNELIANLDDSTVMYGLLRVTEQIDLSTTVKFVYVYFSGEQVPFTKRGRMGVVHGSVRQHFQPYHCDFELTRREELSEDVVQRKVAETSGKIDNVKDASVVYNPTVQVRGYTGVGYTNVGTVRATENKFGFRGATDEARQSVGLTFADDVTEAIQDVRNDKTDTNWCLARYEDDDPRKPVVLLAKGSGGLAELHTYLNEHSIAYGLIRTTDVIDGHETVKFGLILYIGSAVSILKRGKLTPHKGGVVDKFSPFHVQFDVSTVAEISETNVMNKIQAASGSRNWVRG